VVVILSALPLTTNGKVDRAALPAPERRTAAAPAEPGTELERRIRDVWCRVLRCAVGPDDNFFDLGGTSLELAEVHAELLKQLGGQWPLTVLFERPTVRALADHLTGGRAAPVAAPARERAKLQLGAFVLRGQRKGSSS
jgi:hypothetical protein